MMDLSSRTVRFYLSAEGKRALRGLVPTRGSFQALVLSMGDLGPLVWFSAGKPNQSVGHGVPLMLVRWDYIATLTFDYEPERAATPSPIGFSPS